MSAEPRNYQLYRRHDWALVGECRNGVLSVDPGVPDLSLVELSRDGFAVYSVPFGGWLTSRQLAAMRRESSVLYQVTQQAIASCSRALAAYDASPAGRRERRQKELRRLLEWTPPSL
jgi:hypothetical protein